jgi:peroxiredoxin Q/BCP
MNYKIFLGTFLAILISFRAEAASLQVGDPAPNFSAIDDQGKTLSLKEFRGKTVVLYFYPKDNTTGCTIEAKSFRDHSSEFAGKNAVILGVSYDDASSHQAFQQQYQLPFHLLVDSDHKISEAYGSNGPSHASRDTFVIDPKGNIAKIYRSVDPNQHVQDVLQDLK